jgi:hypothetical protein
MSDLRRVILKYVNVESGSLVSSDNGVPRDGNNMTLFVGTQNVIQVHLRMSDGTTYFKPEAGSTWFFGVDDSYTSGHTDYVITNTANFNIIGDWSSLDAANGKICFRADATSSSLRAAIGSLASKNMVGEIWYSPPGGSPTLLCQMTVVIKNIVTEMGSESELVYTSTGILQADGNDLVLLFPDGTVAQRWVRS